MFGKISICVLAALLVASAVGASANSSDVVADDPSLELQSSTMISADSEIHSQDASNQIPNDEDDIDQEDSDDEEASESDDEADERLESE